jgi:hypothetical protein
MKTVTRTGYRSWWLEPMGARTQRPLFVGCAAVDGSVLLQVRKTLGGSHHTTSASTKAAAEAKKGVFSNMFASMVGAERFAEPFRFNPELVPNLLPNPSVSIPNWRRTFCRTLPF